MTMKEYEPKDDASLQEVYKRDKGKLVARLRSMGKSLEDAEDMVQEVYVETLERMPLLSEIRNLSAWISSLLKRRTIDHWRHEKVKQKAGETGIAQETIDEIISAMGLDPLDHYIRECLLDALNDAIYALPMEQREIIEAQIFGGMSFRQMAEVSGESINTLMARKRYALKKLSHALRAWMED